MPDAAIFCSAVTAAQGIMVVGPDRSRSPTVRSRRRFPGLLMVSSGRWAMSAKAAYSAAVRFGDTGLVFLVFIGPGIAGTFFTVIQSLKR